MGPTRHPSNIEEMVPVSRLQEAKIKILIISNSVSMDPFFFPQILLRCNFLRQPLDEHIEHRFQLLERGSVLRPFLRETMDSK